MIAVNVFAVRDGSVDGYPNAREAGTRSDLKQFPFPESHAPAPRKSGFCSGLPRVRGARQTFSCCPDGVRGRLPGH